MASHQARLDAIKNRQKPKLKKEDSTYLGAGLANVTGFQKKDNDLERFLKIQKDKMNSYKAPALKHTSKIGIGISSDVGAGAVPEPVNR